jgi:hypothetical protein
MRNRNTMPMAGIATCNTTRTRTQRKRREHRASSNHPKQGRKSKKGPSLAGKEIFARLETAGHPFNTT